MANKKAITRIAHEYKSIKPNEYFSIITNEENMFQCTRLIFGPFLHSGHFSLFLPWLHIEQPLQSLHRCLLLPGGHGVLLFLNTGFSFVSDCLHSILPVTAVCHCMVKSPVAFPSTSLPADIMFVGTCWQRMILLERPVSGSPDSLLLCLLATPLHFSKHVMMLPHTLSDSKGHSDLFDPFMAPAFMKSFCIKSSYCIFAILHSSLSPCRINKFKVSRLMFQLSVSGGPSNTNVVPLCDVTHLQCPKTLVMRDDLCVFPMAGNGCRQFTGLVTCLTAPATLSPASFKLPISHTGSINCVVHFSSTIVGV